MKLKELLDILKDKTFRTSEVENPELVQAIRELEAQGLVRMMTSADDGSISVALTTDGFHAMEQPGTGLGEQPAEDFI